MPNPFTFHRFACLHTKFGTEITPRLALSLAVMFILLIIDPMPVQAQVQSGKVYVADQASNQVSVINTRTLEVIATLSVGDRPHNVNHTPDGRLAMVSNKNLASDDPPSLSLIDTERDVVVGEVTEIGRRIEHVVAIGNDMAYVSEDLGHNGVAVIDLNQHRMTAMIPTGIKPHGLWPTPDGLHLFVPNQLSGTLSKVEVESGTVVAEALVGRTPTMVVVSPDGRTAYVTLFGERGVAVVDAVGIQDGRLQVNDVIPVGEKPAQIAITPDGRYLLVPCEGPGALFVVATDTHEIVNEIATGERAHGVDVSDDGRHAFVSNWGDNSVSVVDLGQATVIATIPVGREPAGIDFVVQR